ncbi:trace amine-associated receptor 8c [Hydra vulgaris]|uniref:Trace amine-associated receptor 8c n=1 Tax=Hydra vulgaris TaxID=6087 RepID=A0ABM4C8W3_HYDVU
MAIPRLFTDIITAFLVHTVVLHLCGITLDRFIALFFALRYRQIVTIKTTTRYLQSAWFVSFIASAIQVSWLFKELKNIANCIGLKSTNIEKWYSFVMFTLFLFIPMVFLAVAFGAMFCEIRKILLKTPALKVRTKLSGVTVQQRRVLYIFSIMYVCFGIFAMPYFTIRMMEDFKKLEISSVILEVVYALKITPSITNPLLYTANNKDFRKMIKITLLKAKKRLFHPFRKFSFNKLQSFGSDNRQTSIQMSSLVELSAQKSYNINESRTNSFASYNQVNNGCEDNVL